MSDFRVDTENSDGVGSAGTGLNTTLGSCASDCIKNFSYSEKDNDRLTLLFFDNGTTSRSLDDRDVMLVETEALEPEDVVRAWPDMTVSDESHTEIWFFRGRDISIPRAAASSATRSSRLSSEEISSCKTSRSYSLSLNSVGQSCISASDLFFTTGTIMDNSASSTSLTEGENKGYDDGSGTEFSSCSRTGRRDRHGSPSDFLRRCCAARAEAAGAVGCLEQSDGGITPRLVRWSRRPLLIWACPKPPTMTAKALMVHSNLCQVSFDPFVFARLG